MKKVLAGLTLGAMMTLVLAACGGSTSKPGGDGSSKDETGKSILTVATYDGGLKSEWLSEAATRFETKFADTSFETGKKGVSVKVLADKKYNGSTLLSSSLTSDVYFTEDVSYFEHVNKGNFADISGLVTAPLSDFGETRSIEDKLDTNYADYLKAKDGKYYAIPFYDGFYGIIYDVDLFTEKNFFLAADGGFVKNESTEKSLGADGVKGTSDDGLPATYADFTKLNAKIVSAGDTPFSYAGGANEYVMRALMNYWSCYEGKEGMNLNYTLNGNADLVTGINNGVAETSPTQITEDNGYLLQKQAGKYYALSFLKDVFFGKSDNYYVNSDSHLDAETNYIRGSLVDNAREYAMHIDGTWWENESTAAFENCKKQGFAGKTERHFAFMNIPNPVAVEGEHKETIVSQNSSYCFINKNALLPDLAKKFLAFANSDSELSKFTAKTSVTRALDYDTAESDLTGSSSYCRSVIDLKKNSNVIYPYSTKSVIINNPAYFSNETWSWRAIISGASYSNPFQTFLDNSSLSAKDYFDGLSNYFTATSWEALK